MSHAYAIHHDEQFIMYAGWGTVEKNKEATVSVNITWQHRGIWKHTQDKVKGSRQVRQEHPKVMRKRVGCMHHEL